MEVERGNLKDLLEKNKIPFLDTLWLVTCRKAINSNPLTRYLIFFETQSFDNEVYDELKIVIKTQLLSRCFMVVVNEDVSKIKVKNISNNKIRDYDAIEF